MATFYVLATPREGGGPGESKFRYFDDRAEAFAAARELHRGHVVRVLELDGETGLYRPVAPEVWLDGRKEEPDARYSRGLR
jgi:hypothetical protein